MPANTLLFAERKNPIRTPFARPFAPPSDATEADRRRTIKEQAAITVCSFVVRFYAALICL